MSFDLYFLNRPVLGRIADENKKYHLIRKTDVLTKVESTWLERRDNGIIRQMLLHGNPGQYDFFPSSLNRNWTDNEMLKDLYMKYDLLWYDDDWDMTIGQQKNDLIVDIMIRLCMSEYLPNNLKLAAEIRSYMERMREMPEPLQTYKNKIESLMEKGKQYMGVEKLNLPDLEF